MGQVLVDYRERIPAAAAAARDAKEAYDLRVKQRDELIVAAVDEGMTQQAVAALAGVAKGRISAILAKPGDDDE